MNDYAEILREYAQSEDISDTERRNLLAAADENERLREATEAALFSELEQLKAAYKAVYPEILRKYAEAECINWAGRTSLLGAADEIERLRAAANMALEVLEDVPYMSNKDDYARLEKTTSLLRQALEQTLTERERRN